jgi:hypothetical protein
MPCYVCHPECPSTSGSAQEVENKCLEECGTTEWQCEGDIFELCGFAEFIHCHDDPD